MGRWSRDELEEAFQLYQETALKAVVAGARDKCLSFLAEYELTLELLNQESSVHLAPELGVGPEEVTAELIAAGLGELERARQEALRTALELVVDEHGVEMPRLAVILRNIYARYPEEWRRIRRHIEQPATPAAMLARSGVN